MNKKYVIIFIVILIVENILLSFFISWYLENKRFQLYIEQNKGLANECKNIGESESLYSVLDKLSKFRPSIVKDSNESIFLNYGVEWSEATGVSFMFDKSYKLTHKSCNGKWEPEVVSFPLKTE